MHQHIINKYRHVELVESRKQEHRTKCENKRSIANIGKTHTIAGVMAGQELRSNL